MVELVAYDPAWRQAFQMAADDVRAALANATIDLHHIGSTAVPGIVAKPIIDMLGIVGRLDDAGVAGPALASLGYKALGAFGIPRRRYFRRCAADGRRTHHLHVFATGSPDITRHLAFRDYLLAHPDTAAAYGAVKLEAVRADANGWDDYQDAKAPFIAETERAALVWYESRKPRQ